MRMIIIMDKLQLTGRNLGQVFYCRLGRTCIGHAFVQITKQPNLKLKTQAKQLLGFLPLAFCALWHNGLNLDNQYIFLYQCNSSMKNISHTLSLNSFVSRLYIGNIRFSNFNFYILGNVFGGLPSSIQPNSRILTENPPGW